MKVRAAVFASGGGSNFQALLDHQRTEGDWGVVLLVTDREDAGAISRKQNQPKRRGSKPFDQPLGQSIDVG